VRTRFLQVRHFGHMARLLFRGESSARGVSPFQAFALAISGRVGTGNIAGVAAAIAMGGPGAVFWLWTIAFLGAGSAFVEAALAQIYKEEIGGQFRGGPAYYIERGLGMKWYAVLFALSTIVATGLLLPGVQANSIGTAVENAFGLPTMLTGGIVAALLGLIIFGGIKRIGRAAQLMVPFMAIGYILMAVIVTAVHLPEVPAMFALIFKSAFGAEAAFGGIIGMAISWGVKRGIYSNEAGQGTAPMAAGAA
jgi:AGCS family alanine or glycine:cation symporter